MGEPTAASVPTISTFSVTKGGKVDDTYACFQYWDFSLGLDENFERFRANNPILAATDKWLWEMRRILRARFGQVEQHRPLIRLAQAGLDRAVWAPILLWHLCYRELLVSDFLVFWLFPRKLEGILRVRAGDVRPYLAELRNRGLIDRDWSENTISRMASGLPAYVADFGFLQGGTVKEIAPYHLPDEALLYVLHALMEEHANAKAVLEDHRWRQLLMSRSELEQELLRLHQQHKVHFEIAGSLVALELPHSTVAEYVEHLVGQ